MPASVGAGNTVEDFLAHRIACLLVAVLASPRVLDA
jgi:hypothetical protein